MRSPRYRSIAGRQIRLPLALAAVAVIAAVGLATAAGYLLGAMHRAPTGHDAPSATAVTDIPVVCSVRRRRRHRPDRRGRRCG